MPQNKIEYAPKSVIESKLLAALDDKTKVAILCTEQDLEDLLAALQMFGDNMGRLRSTEAKSTALRCAEFGKGLRELKQAAFPQMHPNEKPMFSPSGMMLDENGNRSIFDDVDDEIPCDRCGGLGTIICRCGGDLCVCENQGEMPCPKCG